MSMPPARNVLIVAGGWPGHRPLEVAEIMARELTREGFAPEIIDSLAVLSDAERLAATSLVVLNWHMGVEDEQVRLELAPLLDAVAGGSGLAGIHAGLGDAFRLEVDFQFMVGGQWVAHPGDDGVTYTVNVVDHDHSITHGVEDFSVTSEKYYMHIDPALHVIATTDFDGVAMPIAWTKRWGKGNVFYCSLGHQPAIVEQPPVLQLIRQGMVWAAAPPKG
jgi:type 1 glutamine amidotransferase